MMTGIFLRKKGKHTPFTVLLISSALLLIAGILMLLK